MASRFLIMRTTAIAACTICLESCMTRDNTSSYDIHALAARLHKCTSLLFSTSCYLRSLSYVKIEIGASLTCQRRHSNDAAIREVLRTESRTCIVSFHLWSERRPIPSRVSMESAKVSALYPSMACLLCSERSLTDQLLGADQDFGYPATARSYKHGLHQLHNVLLLTLNVYNLLSLN